MASTFQQECYDLFDMSDRAKTQAGLALRLKAGNITRDQLMAARKAKAKAKAKKSAKKAAKKVAKKRGKK